MNDLDVGKNMVPYSQDEKPIELYLARFEKVNGALTLSGHPRPQIIPFQGEMVIVRSFDAESGSMIEDIRRMALWTDPIEKLNGQLSLAGPANDWKFTPGLEGGTEPFAMRIYYPLLGDL